MTEQKYIPGVCNIGPAERARRRQGGIVGLVITAILLITLLVLHAPLAWRLLLFFPAFSSAIGFLQDVLHFCAGFGLQGLYNVVNSAGVTAEVDQESFRLKDRRKALWIVLLSAGIGAIVAIASLWL